MSQKKPKFNAIIIDTSIFENHGLKFESGILSKLNQFKRSPIDLILPDVIKSEIESHLSKKIQQTRAESLSSIKKSHEYLGITPEISLLYKQMIELIDSDLLANKKMEAFIESTGAKVLCSDDHISIQDVLDKYFSNSPPFQEIGHKKNEFPDAIALITAEKWAAKNKKKILVVSSDNDWKKYCSTTKTLVFHESLSEVLDIFNSFNAPHILIENLENYLCETRNNIFYRKIKEKLQLSANSHWLQINADSYLDWNIDEAIISIQDFEIQKGTKTIQISKDLITIEISINMKLEIKGRFSFTLGDPLDGNYKPFGNTTKTIEITHNEQLLITIENSPQKKPEDLTIESIEIERYWRSVAAHFGKIEPN